MNAKKLEVKFDEWLTSFYSSFLDHASEKSEFMAKEAFYAGAATAAEKIQLLELDVQSLEEEVDELRMNK